VVDMTGSNTWAGFAAIFRNMCPLRAGKAILVSLLTSAIAATLIGRRARSRGKPERTARSSTARPAFPARATRTRPCGSSRAVSCGLMGSGQGYETTLAQCAAERLGARLDDIRVDPRPQRCRPLRHMQPGRARGHPGGVVLLGS
jgi:hypothetical protein